eukprot:s107_g3.t1
MSFRDRFCKQERCRVHATMLGSFWHAGPSLLHVQNSRPALSHQWEPSGKHVPSRLAAVGACGGFLARLLLRRSRSEMICRLSKDAKGLDKVRERQQSMLDRAQDHAAALGGECLAIGYNNSRTKVPWQCRHGHTWDAVPLSVLNNKTWCPECARNRRRIPLQRLQDHARGRGGRCLSTSRYCSSRIKVPWQCKLGHTWEATPNTVLYGGSWCPACSRKGRSRKKRSLKDLQKHAAALGGLCLSTAYGGMRAPAVWQCNEGHTWQARPQDVLNTKGWCPVCAGNAPLDLRRLQEHAKCRGGEYLARKYVNCVSKVTWKCEHGHTWQATPNSVLNMGQWCPHCRKIGLARLRAHAASLGGRCLAV